MQLRINACAEVQQTAGSESLGSLNVRLRITAVSVWAGFAVQEAAAGLCVSGTALRRGSLVLL